MNGKRIPQKLVPWFEARKRYRLSHAHVQMARELGLNPAKLGGMANDRQERWKASLPQFLEQLYLKRFGVPRPAEVISLEELISRQQARKEEKRQAQIKRSGFERIQEK